MRLLSDEIETYLEQLASSVTKQTQRIKRRHLEAFLGFTGDLELRDITKRHAVRYLEEVLMKGGRSPKTTKDTLAHLSAFFNWALVRHAVDYNPFFRLSTLVKKSSRGGSTSNGRKPWTEDELHALFSNVDYKDDRDFERDSRGRLLRTPGIVVWSMAAIAAYSGMRENEIASLTLEDVHEDHFHIPEGKTESSVRDVPIHPAIRPLVRHLKATSRDGFLIPGLTPGGPDAKRAWNFSKTFGRVRRAAGVKRTMADFHALRHGFVTAMKHAGVPAEIRKEIVGHAGKADVHDLYSDAHGLKTLKAAVAKVTYGKKVDELVKGAKWK